MRAVKCATKAVGSLTRAALFSFTNRPDLAARLMETEIDGPRRADGRRRSWRKIFPAGQRDNYRLRHRSDRLEAVGVAGRPKRPAGKTRLLI